MNRLLPSLIPTVPGLKANCALAYTITLPEKPTLDQPQVPIWWLAHQGPQRLPGLDSSACVTVLIVTVRESEQGFLAIHAVSRALLRTAPYCSGMCGWEPRLPRAHLPRRILCCECGHAL